MSDVDIRLVTDADAGELFTLRRAAFVTEAQLYDDPHIPPLTQTLDELRADLAAPGVITLGAWDGARLVGSIRVLGEGTKATLGRFAVAPDRQHEGIGTALLLAIPHHLSPDVSELWVFTGRDSVLNLDLSAPQGTHEHDQAVGDLTYAYLRKILGDGPEDGADEGPEGVRGEAGQSDEVPADQAG